MNDIRTALAEADRGPLDFDVGFDHAMLIKRIAQDPLAWPPGAMQIATGWLLMRRWEILSLPSKQCEPFTKQEER